MKLLREYIKLLIETSPDLSKWARESNYDIERELNDLGLIPIPKGEEGRNRPPSFLGAGAFAQAYEILYKGKRAVAKVTRSKSDVAAYKSIMNDKKNMPTKVARHFPEIYDVIELQPTFDPKHSSFPFPKWIIVTEYLERLPESIKRLYFGYPTSSEVVSNIDWLFNNKERLAKVIHAAIASMTQETPKEMQRIRIQALARENKKYWRAIADYFKNVKDLSDATPPRNVFRKIFPDATAASITEISFAIVDEISSNRFPVNATTDRGLADSSKGSAVQEFLNAMRYVHAQYGWLWADMHSDNVMVRPRTGELVIADVGFFEKKKEKAN